MAIAEKRSYSVDLQKGAEHAVLRAPLATMDNLAHIFEVQVNDSGAAADLSGAVCEAYFIRADGVTVMLDGVVSGSTASVTLGANCYAVPGRFELAVKLTQGDTVHTILRVEGSVTTSRTDAMTGAGTGAQSFEQLIQAVNGAAAEISKRDRVWNLLDNSDFRNSVNQRGTSSYSAAGYTIDRWRLNGALQMTLGDGFITFNNTSSGTLYLEQRIPLEKLTTGATYTVAVKTADGTISCGSCVLSTTLTSTVSTDDFYVQINTGSDCGRLQLRIRAGKTAQVVWVALYEGEYTAETLPAYVPKGYTAELLECQRYYYKIPSNAYISYNGFSGSETNVRVTIPTPVPMIATPSISINSISNLNIYANPNGGTVTAVEVSGVEGNAVILNLTTSGLTAWKPCVMRFNTTAALSAEL